MANNDIQAQMTAIFKLYSKEVTDEIKQSTIKIANEAVRKLKAVSPVRTGKYKAGWSKKTTKNTANGIEVTIYNKKPMVAHLIERGTGKRHTRKGYNRGTMPAQPHIAPVEEWAVKELEKAVEKAVREE